MENIINDSDSKVFSEHLNQEKLDWIKKIKKHSNNINVPYDKSNIDGKAIVYECVDNIVLGKLFQKTLELANESDQLLHVTLITNLAILLKKHTNQNTFIIGTPIYKEEINNDIKDSVLPVLISIPDDVTYKDLLFIVKKSLVESIENQIFGSNPLFLDVEIGGKTSQDKLSDFGIVLENIQEITNLKKYGYNIIFSISTENNEISCKVFYNSQLYDRSNIEDILDRYIKLFDYDLNEKVQNINVLNKRDYLANNSLDGYKLSYSNSSTIHSLFEEQVEKSPNAIAISNETQITYSELNNRANTVAIYLKKQGITTNYLVGVIVNKTINNIINILGILKAGGAYIPIDDNNPRNHNSYIIKDSNIQYLLSDNSNLSNNFECQLINTEDIIKDFSGNKLSNLSIKGDIAYAIYTSGSTGKPKGTLINHSAIINTLIWMRNFYDYCSNDVILHASSLAFDSSISFLFTPLISGSKLVLYDNKELSNYNKLSNICINRFVTRTCLTPNYYSAILDVRSLIIKNMRSVTIAGEEFSDQLVQKHFKTGNNVKLVNEYGPTENSVCSNAWNINKDDKKVFIGYPIQNVAGKIFDNDNNQVPIGAIGEYVLYGKGLAVGYMNKVDLTSEKFVKDEVGQIYYKTGDKVRLYKDNIEFIGRADYQLKINGYRIEVEEIENVINDIENVEKSIVIGKTDSVKSKYLCAFVKANDNFDINRVKAFIGNNLPYYMVPRHIIKVERFPISSSGKIDRKALINQLSEFEENLNFDPPSNQVEEKMFEIWKNVLETDKIGINNSFFTINGDSIKSIKLISDINKSFDIELAAIDLYSNNTIKTLSDRITKIKNKVINNEEIDVVEKEFFDLKSKILNNDSTVKE